MSSTWNRSFALATAGLLLLLGIALCGGGAWLIALGGSRYYLMAGLAALLAAVCLFRGNPLALWVFAALLLTTLVWSLWEAGLDWWPLAARGDILFVIGLLLLTPWVARSFRTSPGGDASLDARASKGTGRARLALASSLGAFLAVGVVSWFMAPDRITGTLPAARGAAITGPESIPAGEWHAYGRTGHGQRYSPLDQITPDERRPARGGLDLPHRRRARPTPAIRRRRPSRSRR